jgi:cell division protein FtsL
MILSTLANISSAVSTTVSTAITDWSKRKTVSAETKAKAELLKVETELRVLQIEAQARTAEAQTKLEMAKQGQKIDFELDRESVRQMQKSWKDEFLLLLFSLPVILTFIPSMQPYVQKGWEMLNQAPEWFLWLYAAMIISVWGLRGIARSVLESRFMKK